MSASHYLQNKITVQTSHGSHACTLRQATTHTRTTDYIWVEHRLIPPEHQRWDMSNSREISTATSPSVTWRTSNPWPAAPINWQHADSAMQEKFILGRGADRSLARHTSRCRRAESIVSLERGVCSCAEFKVFSCYRGWKKASQVTRAISTTWRGELSSSFFFLLGKAPKEIHDILTETLGEHAPSYATVKNWVAQFKRGDFSTCDAPRPGRPKTVTTSEIIDQIHELILKDRRISDKSVAVQLGISRERVGSIIQEDLEVRKFSAKWVPKCLSADQKCHRCQSSEQILESRSKWFPVANGDHGRNLVLSLCPRDKATINGVAAQRLTPPQKILSTKIRWKISRIDF